MNLKNLTKIAEAMVANSKGLLAADESTGTIAKRLTSINVEPTLENRRDYRELLFRTSGAGKFISGVILYDETIRQNARDGSPFIDILNDEGIIPGIKVDMGAKPLAGSSGETVTEGLDGLSKRIADYAKLGAKFAKWRAVIKIGSNIPSQMCIDANAHALGRYAKICQEGGVVPIVEPEVLMDGEHSIEQCQIITERTLNSTFWELNKNEVKLEGIILKPNMIIPGKAARVSASVDEVASKTLETLSRCVPLAVPGIMFLSGGQSETEATAHLNAMNFLSKKHLWKLSFSYGRALQQSALKAWSGKKENIIPAQNAYLKRAEENSEACSGTRG